jgi:peptidoglycan-associated lipoprotein
MKKLRYVFWSWVLLCLLGTACRHNAKSVAGGTKQIQAPVEPPTQTEQPTQAATASPKGTTVLQTTAQPPAAAPKKLSPQQRSDLNQLLARMSDAFFDYNETAIRTDAMTALSQDVGVIRNILADYPTEKLRIEGHADERGSAEYNLALADRRGRTAQEFLSARGIPQNQLVVLSYGEERPVCTDQTEACYQQNRRVHITVAP